MTLNESKSDRLATVLWTCELNTQQTTQTFTVPSDGISADHQLSLKMVCLGVGAKDELNVVEIVPEDASGVSIPIAALQASSMPMTLLCDLDLTPPVTFRLSSGSGPIHVTGQDVTLEDYTWSEEEDEGEVEDEEEAEEETPPKAAKRPAPTKKAGPSKKKRTETKEEEDSDEETLVKKTKVKAKKVKK
uniref:Nucleophosmin/nucleoplasmin 2 n=1 Tax=Callorhinchus milii TaxID=7868 RepID=V9L7E8_CALMI|eukprot:gi/632989347/ref/XP_007883604.1/ PREDICTED: nucleoplasmin-2 [Callorhinchus milii]